MSPKGAYIGPMTQQCRDLVRAINAMIRQALGETTFHWGSLQINEDSVSEVHTDKNNLGKSFAMLFGVVAGATFDVAPRKSARDSSARRGERLEELPGKKACHSNVIVLIQRM